MRRFPRASSRLALCTAVALLFAACSKPEEPKPAAAPPPPPAAAAPVAFKVTSIDLGSAIGPDKKVSAPATAFKPGDTIFASVVTDGTAPSVILAVRWTYEDGQLVNESSQTIAPTGPAATEFHIAKPDGWPAGKYKVDLAANGVPAGSREFTVTN
ncbi:MAG: hypothetical protein ACRERC_17385 [Candidatus Binatia bacterium]